MAISKIKVGNTEHELQTTISNISGLQEKLSDIDEKLSVTNIAYCTCSTAATDAQKIIDVQGNEEWELSTGAIIMVFFSYSNSAENVTFNVNGSGAYPLYYNNAAYVGSSSAYTGYANRTITYAFNGTHWVWISSSYDANTQSNTNSTDSNSKIFLVGATSQGSNKTTYSHNEVYVGTDHHVYSNGKQAVNLSDTQALTNKTYNGYTLGAACAKGVDTTVTSGGANLITSGGAYTALANKVNTSAIGAANGVASLDANGKVPTAQLPSYVDDVLEYSVKSSFPTTGETGKIYVDTSTNKTYRWSGSAYVEISASLALGETSSTAYRGDRGKTAYDHASAKGSAFSSGLYKITTNAQGHVTAATAVTKADIVALLGFTPLTSAEIDAKINAAITSAIAASY